MSGKWIVVDSLFDEHRRSVPLMYLESIGVNLVNDVTAILITHWHDDHVAGVGELVQSCPNAVVAMPLVFQSDEFIAFLQSMNSIMENSFRSGVSELFNVFRSLQSRKASPCYCLGRRIIFESRSLGVRFEALSPDDKDVTEFLQAIVKTPTDRPRIPAPDRNEASVASVLEWQDVIALFGGDLENRANSGWTSLISNAWGDRGQANFFKIAHHGSKTGHNEQVWSDILIDDVTSALTPWNRSSKLPTKEDVERICGLTKDAHSAGRPVAFRARKRLSTVEKELISMKIGLWRERSEVGQLRFTRNAGNWEVEYLGKGSGPLYSMLKAQ